MLPSRRNYQLRDNHAVDISLFKRCIVFAYNVYFAVNMIGIELEYLTGHYDPSDIPCLSALHTYCLAVLVMAVRILPGVRPLRSRHFVWTLPNAWQVLPAVALTMLVAFNIRCSILEHLISHHELSSARDSMECERFQIRSFGVRRCMVRI